MGQLTKEEKDSLFQHNINELNKMNIAAGSMVKGLIQELDRKKRNTFIKLRDAVESGHAVSYDVLEGDPALVRRIGKALGLKTITESKLEVRSR